MPRKFQMSWEGPPAYRWVKMYRGQRYRIACADLHLPKEKWTKELSYQAANDWWFTQKTKLDAKRQDNHPHAEALDELQRRLDYAYRHGLEDDAHTLESQIEQVKQTPPDQPAMPTSERATQIIAGLRLLGCEIPDDLDPYVFAEVFGDERIWAERFRQDKLVSADKTLGALAAKWNAIKADEARNGLRSPDGANNIRVSLDHFVQFVGPSLPADAITADIWHRWYNRCAAAVVQRDHDPEAGWSVDYARRVFLIAKSFIRWLWEIQAIDQWPRNLTSKKYRFERPDAEIPTFNNEEIHLLFNTASSQHKLHLLLMLNTGMTQKDISDLRKDQLDLGRDAGTIKRRRSKTATLKNTPEVCYPLWPETLRLLKKHLSNDPVYALLTRSGRRWVRKKMLETGQLKRTDSVAALWLDLRQKLNLTAKGKSLKTFRKTSATRLNTNKDYRDLRHLFLGHSPSNQADKSYAAAAQDLLAEAVRWLGQQYGFAQ
jgi:integrase